HSIMFEPGGYGWLLVLRHNDGYYTCYAHLDGFPDRVRDAYRARLAALERSYGYARLDAKDTTWVKKGEVIAYTGETGAGPAHLHFEVRDRDYNPVNPGLSRNLRPADSIPPELKQLCIVPLDAATSIDGKWEEKFENIRGSGSSFRVGDMPVIRGRAGLMLRAHDRAGGATDYPTPYKISVYVDGSEEFTTVSNRFSDTLGFHIRIDRDHWLMKRRKGEFRKLFREAGNHLETYWPRDAEAGVLSATSLGSGEKRLLIAAEDLDGNRSLLSMTVMLVAEMGLEHRIEGNALSLRTTGDCAALLLEQKTGAEWKEIRRWDRAEAAAGVRMELRRHREGSLRAVTVDAHGNAAVQATWMPGAPKHSAGRLYPRREIHYDEIVYDLKVAAPFAAPPRVRITQGTRTEEARVFPLDDDSYRAVLPTWPGFSGEAEVAVDYRVGRKEVHWKDQIEGFHISARYGGQLRSRDGRFVLSFAPGDVYRSLLCTLDAAALDSAASWTVGPADTPLAGRPLASVIAGRRGSSLLLTADYPVKNYGAVSLPRSPAVAARFGRFLGTYHLRHDEVGPDISVAFALRSREPIRIAIRDSVSGVDWNSIAVYIDRALIPVEFNERRNVLVVPYDVYKSIGKGTVTVRARDRLGNSTVIKRKM
ncbi:MAG: M23 family metallopeptidase, partial [Bacteroidota bacterium]|nr:M23 family metallopeptidase [Bacteroidota bacterium]